MAERKNNKAGVLVGAGAIAAGVSLLLMNTGTRTKIKNSSVQMKDKVSNYATTVKEDPQGTKNAIIDKVKRTTAITKDTVQKIQQILDNQGQEIKNTTKDAVEQTKDITKETKTIASTAKDAKEDFKEAGQDLKSEMKSSDSKESDHHVENQPVHHQ